MAATAAALLSRPDDLVRLADLAESDIQSARAAYWRALSELGVDVAGGTLVDKQPFNTVRLPLIAKLFPDAKIVFCLRDPRDVVLSCFRRRFLMTATNFEFLTLEGAAALYAAVMDLASTYRATLPLAIHMLKHEALIGDFEPRLRELCEFLELSWIDRFHEFAGRSARRDVATPSAAQILRGLNQEGVGHWRNYRKHLTRVLPVLTPWVERFNYPGD
jgi:hypothetical protein